MAASDTSSTDPPAAPHAEAPDDPEADARRRRSTYLAVALFYGLLATFAALMIWAHDLMATRIEAGVRVGHVIAACVLVGVWLVVRLYSRVRFGAERGAVSSR